MAVLSSLQCHPSDTGFTLESIIKEIPKVYLKDHFPRYTLYSKIVLWPDRCVDVWCRFARGREKMIRHKLEKEPPKTDSYRDIIDLFSKHIGQTDKQMEYCLQRLEDFVGNRRLPDTDDETDANPICRVCREKRQVIELNDRSSNDAEDILNETHTESTDDEFRPENCCTCSKPSKSEVTEKCTQNETLVKRLRKKRKRSDCDDDDDGGSHGDDADTISQSVKRPRLRLCGILNA